MEGKSSGKTVRFLSLLPMVRAEFADSDFENTKL